MALESWGAFAAGVAVGWAGRSLAGSTREALVRIVVTGHMLKNDARRAIAERVEWVEDLMAEGRIRYEETIGSPRVNADVSPDSAFWSAEASRTPGMDAGSNEGGRAA